MAIAIVKPQLVTLNCFPFDLDAQRPVLKPELDSGLDSGLDWLLLNGVGINKKKKKKILFFGVQCNISSCASNNAQ